MARKNLTDKLQEAYRELLKQNKFWEVKDLIKVTNTQPSTEVLEEVCLYQLCDAKSNDSDHRPQKYRLGCLGKLLDVFDDYKASEKVVDAIQETYREHAKEGRMRGLGRVWGMMYGHMPAGKIELPEDVVEMCVYHKDFEELLSGFKDYGCGGDDSIAKLYFSLHKMKSFIQKAYKIKLCGEERSKSGGPVRNRELTDIVKRVQSLYELTGVELPEASVQSFYKECFNYDLNGSWVGSGLIALKKLNNLTKVKPIVCEPIIHGIYAHYAVCGLGNNIKSLFEICEITPEIPEEIIQRGYEYCLTGNYLASALDGRGNSLAGPIKMREITGIEPKLSPEIVEKSYQAVEEEYLYKSSHVNVGHKKWQEEFRQKAIQLVADIETLTGIKPLSKTYSGIIRETKEE